MICISTFQARKQQMKRLAASIAFVLLCSMSAHSQGQTKPLQCNIGPIARNYGDASWLTYSCTDMRTFVFVSAPGTPAFPFVFVLSPKDGGYQLQGEGTGSKAASDAAAAEIQKISAAGLADLLGQTRNTQSAPKQ